MHCILVTGIPAAGKSTMAETLSQKLKWPVISKDTIKELLFDHVGFQSREEKVNLGIASMEIMYYAAKQLMKTGQPFILENNFEYSSESGIRNLLEKYHYSALTIVLTGDYPTIYQRFLERNISPDRHRGHVVNDCYPEKIPHSTEQLKAASISYEDYLYGMKNRGFEDFSIDGGRIVIDTTDFSKIDMQKIFLQILAWRKETVTVPSVSSNTLHDAQ